MALDCTGASTEAAAKSTWNSGAAMTLHHVAFVESKTTTSPPSPPKNEEGKQVLSSHRIWLSLERGYDLGETSCLIYGQSGESWPFIYVMIQHWGGMFSIPKVVWEVIRASSIFSDAYYEQWSFTVLSA